MKIVYVVLIIFIVIAMTMNIHERYENLCGMCSVLNDQYNESDDRYAVYGTPQTYPCNWQNPSASWGIIRKQEKEQHASQIAYAKKLDYHTRMHTDHCNVEEARNFAM